MKKLLLGFVLVLATLFTSVWATPTTLYEVEPNDTPVEATPFSGEILLTGMIKKGDQDAYMWKIGEEDSQYSWNIELVGVPSAMTRIDIMKVIFTPDGKEVEDYQKFFSFGTRTGNKPVHLNNLLFEKGKYLLALSFKSKEEENEAKSYQIIITKHRKVYRFIKADAQKEAENLTTRDYNDNDFYHYQFKQSAGWFKFKIDKKGSQKLWTIRGISTIGHETNIKLFDEADTVITQSTSNKFGKFKLEDLELDKGTYYLHCKGDAKALYAGFKVYATGNQKIDEHEVEPNNNEAEANAINFKKTIHGKVNKSGDRDYFSFSLPKKYEEKIFDIKLNIDDKDADFYLYNSQGNRLQEKNYDSNYTMPNLMLETGKNYMLGVYDRDKKDINYTIHFSEAREYNSSGEAEPNDSKERSSGIVTGRKINGEFIGGEYDCYRFSIDKPNSFWNLQSEGNTLELMRLYQNKKELFDTREKNNNKLIVKNMFLLPGVYETCLYGDNGSYSLSVTQSSLADLNISSIEDIEHEPNQNKSQTNALKFGQRIKGVAESKENEDYFHFTLKNYENIRLTATSPKEGDVRFIMESNLLRNYARPNVGEIATIEGVYPPGRYTIELWNEKPSYGFYTLKLERLNFFNAGDIEPNDKYNLANSLPLSFNIKGHSGSRDDDYYKLPDFMTRETNVSISGKNIKDKVFFYLSDTDTNDYLKWNDKNKTYTSTLKTPNRSYFVVKDGTGYYDYNLSFTKYTPKHKKELNLSLNLNIENSEVAAYSEYGQKIQFSVDMESLTDVGLNIESHISDSSWKLISDKNISLKSKEKKTLLFRLMIPKNIGKTPVVTTLKFSNKNGAFKTVSFEIQPKDNAKALNSYDDWGLPDSLLGGLNVARLDFGAKRILEHKETNLAYVPDIGTNYHQLFDDMVYSSGFYLYSNRKNADENVSIELAGNAPSEIMGVILNPFSRGSKAEQLKDFSIALSLDGKRYQPVYKGILSLTHQDQAFAFDKPYKAKYARLTLHNNYKNEPKGAIGLGEWKVIANQESVQGLEAFNIANPSLGGHVVKASKILSNDWDREILTKKDDMRSSTYLYKKDKTLSWVVGFKNERIAKINEMHWREPNRSQQKSYMKKVKILVSTQTPNGPWKEMEDWRKGESNESVYKFKQPTWARYVKFVFPIEKTTYYALPETLQIFEETPSTDYHSILGEWGKRSHRSFYEYEERKNDKPLKVIQGNETKAKAFALDVNQTIQGRVSVANHEEDWYKIVIPKGHNQFQATLSGKESVDVNYELFENNGSKVEPSKILKLPLEHQYWFEVQEGTYYLKVKQPPVSVMFAWDNSGSVSPYHAKIFSAVNNYIQTIQPHIDAVNLLCFNSKNKFLLSDFSDKPRQIETIFNNFDRDCSDSDAERSLRISSEKLKNREGTKGVIIIGDAVGSRDIKLWSMLKEVKPKVFAIRVESQYHDNEMYEGIMQSWSRVNNGTYSVVSNGVELYQAINRASAILRRPVYYTLRVQSDYVRPLGDGSLKIVPAKGVKVNKNFAIELILDASGSMLKRIHGKRRIAIARDVLKKAVRDIIPPKTAVALRVFGHKKADSCRTDLEMRLQALNVGKTTKIISKINAKNLAKTPIAASLAKVADDLKTVHGKKVVILVTDGEETCDGDPAKEIQALKEKGIDVRINIVGFAIDNEALKAQFKSWAELGDGAYFEANDQKSLNEAVKKALQVPYKVYDKRDTLVASGVVGGKETALKGGSYKVVVETSPQQVFEEVIVVGEQMKQATLKDEK